MEHTALEAECPDPNANLSDVIEVIETDPDFRDVLLKSNMFNGGGEIPPTQPMTTQTAQQIRRQAQIRIIEQPASKALRFRYECEGRSAGSIPGVSSTSENKTFPTIQIVGFQGRAVVVVSCVTKDPPHRPHPHNLVGREGCKKGVCTLEIPTETMTVQFSNLGIQCVKKKDIEQALKVREEIRVDPFRTGFGHRNQPTTIDLNAVRLCFQVFLEGSTPGKFSVPLTPVVSDPIYDKKAMSDLSIFKMSHCTSYVDGGKTDMILLCEKVAKEDIQVRFYEENGDWEAFADFQPTQVYKQHAIWFKTPKYKTVDVTEPVKVFIQLRRPSDGATSESLPFELLPIDSGRRSFWRNREKMFKDHFNFFNTVLNNENNKMISNQYIAPASVEKQSTQTASLPVKCTPQEVIAPNILQEKEKVTETIKSVDLDDIKIEDLNKTVQEIDEIDKIYTENQVQLLKNLLNNDEEQLTTNVVTNEVFDDAKTYSSLQLALKNPVNINEPYEDVLINNTVAKNGGSCVKRENDAEKPPLPPKRTKKIETFIGETIPEVSQNNNSITNLSKSYLDMKSTGISRSSLVNLDRSSSQTEIPTNKMLPPIPNYSTLPNPKKKNFFSKLFSRKSKTPSQSREGSVSLSTKSLVKTPDLTKSSGNISTVSSNSIHIPLKVDPPSQKEEYYRRSLTGSIISDMQNMKNDDFVMNLDVTEAEHYALYTTIAPHATQSEFDEMSCYYAPVEGHK